MATNYKQPGKILTLTAPYQRNSGEAAQVGSIIGVALGTVANATEGEFATEGVWTLPKTSAQAWTVGQRIYWDNSNKRCDSDPTVGQLMGVATTVAANPSSTGTVRLNEAVPSLAEGAQATVAAVATADADGTYGAAEATLINEIKTQFNDVLAKLKTVGIIASS